MAKAKKKVEKRTRGNDPGTSAPSGSDVDADVAQDAFFGDMMTAFAAMTEDHHVLLSIPVWGYPGHGKTSSILTAIHYCKAHLHGASLALVVDPDDLTTTAGHYPQFRSSELAMIAGTTRAFLGDLMARFFVENEWPDATEQPANYLLEVQTVSGTLGFVVIPDLRGGSYETSDDTSKNALANAHAMVILISPREYADEGTPRAADYKKEVLRRIQHCARAKIPTCIMITMADVYGETGDAADRTEKELTRLLAGQVNDFQAFSRLSRVSVVGRSGADASGKPVAATNRNPDALIAAWAWTLRQALTHPRDAIRKQPPQLDLRADVRGRQVEAPAIPTLRQVADAQVGPGSVLCALRRDEDDGDVYVFRQDDGKLIEVRLSRESAKVELLREIVTDGVVDEDSIVRAIGTVLLVGSGLDASSLLYGARGQPLIRTSLPVVLQSWTPVEPRRIIGVSRDGVLHSLQLRGDTWEDTHHVPNFVSPAENLTCGYVSGHRMAVVANGTDVVGVELSQRGRFGSLRRPAIAARFDGTYCTINSDGFFAARSNDASIVGGREKQVAIGSAHPDWLPDIALCDDAPLLAWITPGSRLRAALLGKKLSVSPEETSPLVESPPTGLAWSVGGEILVLTCEPDKVVWFGREGF